MVMPAQNISAFSIYKNVQSKKSIIRKKKNRKQKPVALRKTEKVKINGPLKISQMRNHPNKSKTMKTKEVNNLKVFEETNCQSTADISHDNPSSEALQLLEWMISPLPPDDFFQTYWERKPVHVKRKQLTYYTKIFSSASLDKILRNNQLYYSRNVDVVSYENGVKEVFNLEGRATPSVLWDYYANGCSIRVLNPQTYDKRVHLLLATLQEHFSTMVGANVYLTPPGSQGFAPHYDDIEAFVVQLEGRKYWKLYAPRDEDVLARYSSPNFQHADLGPPFMEVTLNAGDLLYFPRGVIHEARTDADAHSLHVTISMYQQTAYVDLLEHILPMALKKAAKHDVEFRRGLPLDYLKKNRGGHTNLVARKVQELLHSMIQYVDVDQGSGQMGKKFIYDSMPPVLSKDEAKRTCQADGTYLKNGKVCNRVEITADTKIRLIRYYCVQVVDQEGTSPKLYYNTENARVYHGEEEQWFELDSNMVPAVQTLQATFPNYMKIDNLPMQDQSSKMQLVADLWEHGLLITERPLQTT